MAFRLTAIVSRKWSSLSLLLSTPPMLNSVGLLSFNVDGFCMMANLMCRKMMRCSKMFTNAMMSCLSSSLLSFFLIRFVWFSLASGFHLSTLAHTRTHTKRNKNSFAHFSYFLLAFINI